MSCPYLTDDKFCQLKDGINIRNKKFSFCNNICRGNNFEYKQECPEFIYKHGYINLGKNFKGFCCPYLNEDKYCENRDYFNVSSKQFSFCNSVCRNAEGVFKTECPYYKFPEDINTNLSGDSSINVVINKTNVINTNNSYKFCGKCGNQNNIANNFCGVCGTKI